MTYLVDADALSAVLERQVDFLVGQKGDQRIYLLPRFIEFVEREPRLSALLSEMREEARSAEISFDECAARLRTGLQEIWRSCHAQIAGICQTALDSDAFNDCGRFDRYESDLQVSDGFAFAPERPPDDEHLPVANRLRSLKYWCLWTIQTLESQSPIVPAELADARHNLEHLQRRYARAFRKLRVQDRTLGWLAYRRLRYWSSRLAPEPPPENSNHSVEVEFWEADRDATVLHGGQTEPYTIHTPVEMEKLAGDLECDLRLLHHDLRIRLSMGHSRMALVRRYAARCEGYDAPRLRDVAARKPRTAENELRLDFARYLFDQGLRPILDGTVGALRPDVLDPTGATAIYVEAKQYAKSPRTMLKAAVRQVWSTWARLRMQYDIPEAFLVVFRRAGPLISPDVMTVRYEGQKLHLVLVDIAADAGSRERHKPITIAAADLLPDLENGDRSRAPSRMKSSPTSPRRRARGAKRRPRSSTARTGR